MYLRATTLIRNDTLIRARKEMGLTQIKAAKRIGVPLDVLVGLESLQFNLRKMEKSKRELVLSAEKIAAFFSISIDDVLPEELRDTNVPTKFVRVSEISPKLLVAAMLEKPKELPAPEDVAVANESKAALYAAIATLTKREREVIRARFGLPPYKKQLTLEEAGARHGVCKERARAIELRAIRKLQHPIRSDKLYMAVDGGFERKEEEERKKAAWRKRKPFLTRCPTVGNEHGTNTKLNGCSGSDEQELCRGTSGGGTDS